MGAGADLQAFIEIEPMPILDIQNSPTLTYKKDREKHAQKKNRINGRVGELGFRVHRGTSLIRNTHPPRITAGP